MKSKIIASLHQAGKSNKLLNDIYVSVKNNGYKKNDTLIFVFDQQAHMINYLWHMIHECSLEKDVSYTFTNKIDLVREYFSKHELNILFFDTFLEVKKYFEENDIDFVNCGENYHFFIDKRSYHEDYDILDKLIKYSNITLTHELNSNTLKLCENYFWKNNAFKTEETLINGGKEFLKQLEIQHFTESGHLYRLVDSVEFVHMVYWYMTGTHYLLSYVQKERNKDNIKNTVDVYKFVRDNELQRYQEGE